LGVSQNPARLSFPVDFLGKHPMVSPGNDPFVQRLSHPAGVMSMNIFFSNFIKKTICLATIFLLLSMGSGSAATGMPAFNLPDAVTGAAVNSSVFTGKTLLITFFATWCPPCMQEIPTLIDLHQHFSGDNFSVIALSVDEGGPKVVAKLVKNRSITYPVLMADEGTAQNFGGIVGIPTSFLVNKEGNIVKKYPGYIPHSILERDINQILH
jgi:thiol-disulfide isomerase/thioredoxin